MSYCRMGEDGSTVYAFRGENWETITRDYVMVDKTLENFRDRLKGLRADGEIIPFYVFERIDAELRGEDPKGDEMRAFIIEVVSEHQ